MAKCKCEWCEREEKTKGYCSKHYQQICIHGECRHTSADQHHFIIIDDYALMPTYDKDGNFKENIIIDIDDIERVKQYKWHIKVGNNKHVEGKVNGKVKQLHRFIMQEENQKILIDHINRNPLDNRKSNLRRCTKRENCRNQKKHKDNQVGHKNITLKKDGKYHVHIYKDYKQYYIGGYANLEDAIKARDIALEQLHGEFASNGE